MKTLVEELVEALEGVVPRCGFVWKTREDCDEIGVWLWDDYDGRTWKCDKHKNDNIYDIKPEYDEDIGMACAVLIRARTEKESDGIDFGEFASDLIENAPSMIDDNGEIIPIVAIEIKK